MSKLSFPEGTEVVKDNCTYLVLFYKEGYYYVECNKCSKDFELFPNKVIKTNRHCLSTPDRYSCFCGKGFKANTQQHHIINKRCAEVQGILYKGSYGKPRNNSRLKLEFSEEGICTFTTTQNQLRLGRATNVLRNSEKLKQVNLLDDSLMIERAFVKGKLPESYKIYRDESSKSNYWYVECSKCKEDYYGEQGLPYTFISHMSNLQDGKLPCRCSKSHMFTEEERLVDIRLILGDDPTVEMVGGFKGNNTLIQYTCCDNLTQRSLVSLLGGGKICGQCKHSGGDIGTLYLVKWYHPHKGYFLKYGVTGLSNVKRRFTRQASRTDSKFVEVVFLLFSEDRDTVEFLEGVFKILCLHNHFMDKEDFPDGYTETVSYSKDNILRFIDIYNYFIQNQVRRVDYLISKSEHLKNLRFWITEQRENNREFDILKRFCLEKRDLVLNNIPTLEEERGIRSKIKTPYTQCTELTREHILVSNWSDIEDYFVNELEEGE